MLIRISRVLLLVLVAQLSSLVVSAATRNLGSRTQMTGDQMQWHKLSLTFDGPSVSESQSVNPFRNYRMDVTFKHASSGRVFRVPGYFAADGSAHNTSASSGSQWRANFSPDATGAWSYVVSFRTGADVAVAGSPSAGSATSFNGESGSFTVDPSNKTGADFRAKGRLQEVGQHYLQHLGSKEYFIKAGAGSPENFLAYADFDNTPAGKKPLHHYSKHLAHYRSGDTTWKNGKGKAIIGALNYLAGKKMNSVYFLTMNVGGDGDDVFPWTTKSERYRFDVSKLAQWEMVFDHMDRLGIHLNLFTQERENDRLLDGGSLGLQRKLYYRELIARFGHHLGLTWNLGEENTNSAAQRTAFADYFNEHDPYRHMIAVHTYPSERDAIYGPMISHPVIGGASLQLQSPSIVHAETLKWVKRSADSGQKWVVTLDELGSASVGVKPDANDPNHSEVLHRALWGSLMAGAAGVEWYFGYNYPHHDLTCEDWTTRDNMWTLTHYAAQFFRDYMPLPLVANYNSITSSSSDYCFGKPGVAYAIYLPGGATTSITLPSGQNYSVRWFNPRRGGALQSGTVTMVKGGAAASVGKPPSETSSDWVALLRRSDDTSGDPQPPPTAPATMSVSKLTLVSSSTQDDLRALTNGSVIDLSKDGSSLNVRADTTGPIGSVVFHLNGSKYHDESAKPYALGRDDDGVYRKWKPAIGKHTLRVVPYSGIKGGGAVGIPLEVSFTVVAAASKPPSPPATTMTVSNLTLVNSATQSDLRSLTNGSVIDLSKDGSSLNVRADTTGTIGSVVFYIDGSKYHDESAKPYALGRDDDGVYRKWTPTIGTHTLKVVPYSGIKGSGLAGTPLQVTFTVTAASTTPPPPTTMSVSNLTLVNSATQADLRSLTNGSVIDLSKDGSSLNVRADTTGTIGSVVFYFDGSKYHDESAKPYALGRDDDGVYRKWTPKIGTHTLKVVPYSGIKGGGSVGIPIEVTFKVVAGAAPVPTPTLAITKLVLVNAATQRDLRVLTNGATIDLSRDGSALNIRADVGSSVGSVWFTWDGVSKVVENQAVYAFAKDDAGVYRKWTPSVGTHTLRAVPYAQDNRGGTAGTAMEITVKVVN